MPAVLVDVDGTLLSGPTSEVLFAGFLWRRGRLGARQVAGAALFVPRWTARYGRHVFKKNKAYLAGLAVDDVAALAEEFVRDELADRLRPAIVARIDAHRAAGDAVALVTGTPDFIAAALAARIGVELWAASLPARHNGAFTADPPPVHPFSDEKVKVSQELCGRLGCALDEAAAYADSAYDLPLLRRVGRPVAVCPDPHLERAARGAGWEILDG